MSWTGSSRGSRSSSRSWWSSTRPTTRRSPSSTVRRHGSARPHPGQHVRPRTGQRDPVRHRPCPQPGRRGHHGRRQRRPAADRRRWPGWSSGASSSLPPPATRPGGQQVGGPCSRRCCRARPGARSALFARVGTRRRHQQLQGVLDRVRPRGGHRQPQRLRDRARADRQGAPAAPARRRDPDDLAGPDARRVQLRPRRLDARVPALVPLRLRADG